MLDQTPQIPPAVIEFAKENNCHSISASVWNEFNKNKNFSEKIYNVKCEKYPNVVWFIISDKKEVRFATPEEYQKYSNLYL